MCILCVAAGSGAAASSSRNLWVSGLSSTTRATDLKTLFSKYGKVRLYTPLPTMPRRFFYIRCENNIFFPFYPYVSISCRLSELRWWPTLRALGLVAMALSPCLPQMKPPIVSATFTGRSCMAGWSPWSGSVLDKDWSYIVVCSQVFQLSNNHPDETTWIWINLSICCICKNHFMLFNSKLIISFANLMDCDYTWHSVLIGNACTKVSRGIRQARWV